MGHVNYWIVCERPGLFVRIKCLGCLSPKSERDIEETFGHAPRSVELSMAETTGILQRERKTCTQGLCHLTARITNKHTWLSSMAIRTLNLYWAIKFSSSNYQHLLVFGYNQSLTKLSLISCSGDWFNKRIHLHPFLIG